MDTAPNAPAVTAAGPLVQLVAIVGLRLLLRDTAS
jgi:hypothetical protein